LVGQSTNVVKPTVVGAGLNPRAHNATQSTGSCTRFRDNSVIAANTAAESVTPQAQQDAHSCGGCEAAQYPTAADPTPGQQGNRTNKSTEDAHADAPAQTPRHNGYTTEPTPSSDSAIPRLIRNPGSLPNKIIIRARIDNR
jgi:hypothetical protein